MANCWNYDSFQVSVPSLCTEITLAQFYAKPALLFTLAAYGDRGLLPSSTRAAEEEVTTETGWHMQRVAKGSRSEVCFHAHVCLLCVLITSSELWERRVIFMQPRWTRVCLNCLLRREPNATKSHFPFLRLLLSHSARPSGRWKMFMRKILKWETRLVWRRKSARRHKT